MIVLFIVLFIIGVCVLISMDQSDFGGIIIGLVILVGSLPFLVKATNNDGYPALKSDRKVDTIYRVVSRIELTDGTKLIIVREPDDDLRLFQLVPEDEISSSTILTIHLTDLLSP